MNKLFLLLFVVLFSIPLYCDGSEELNNVVVTHEIVDGNNMAFYAENTALFPQQLIVTLEEVKNYTSEFGDTFYTILNKGEKIKIFELKCTGDNASVKYKFSWYIGNPNITPDLEKIYLFPFEHGKKWRVTQGYRGKETHFGESLYAVDFNLDEGSVITAARGGVVVDIKNRGILAYPDASYLDSGNHIIIYHDDGTFGMYAHLTYKGNRVEVGDIVKAGDLIGYSGNTGYSTGPHLHFAVLKPVYCGSVSIPTKFLNYDDRLVEIEDGKYYYGYNPEKGKIKDKLGRDLTNADFSSDKFVPTNGKIEIIKETIDEVSVFYCRNGFDKDMEVEFGVKESENIFMSKEMPIKLTVKKNSRKFIVFTRPIDNKITSRMIYYYNYSEKKEKK